MNDPAASGWLWQIIYGVATSIFGGVAGAGGFVMWTRKKIEEHDEAILDLKTSIRDAIEHFNRRADRQEDRADAYHHETMKVLMDLQNSLRRPP